MRRIYVQYIGETLKIAIPAACAQAVQLILMIYLSRGAGTLGLSRLAANGLAEILIVVTAIQPVIAFGLGLSAVVSHQIGSASGAGENKLLTARTTTTRSKKTNGRRPAGGGWESDTFTPAKEDDVTNVAQHQQATDAAAHELDGLLTMRDRSGGGKNNNNSNHRHHHSRITSSNSGSDNASGTVSIGAPSEEEDGAADILARLSHDQQQHRWQDTNPEAVWSFWSSSCLSVGFSVFVCTPLALIFGPLLLKLAGVTPEVVALANHQLVLLFAYPLLFAIYFCLAQLCVVEKRSDILVWASLPVLVVVIPYLSLHFDTAGAAGGHHNNHHNEEQQHGDTTTSPITNQKKISTGNRFSISAASEPGLTTLALVWLFSMVLELFLIVCMSIRANIIPPFGAVLDTVHMRTPKLFRLPFRDYLKTLVYDQRAATLLMQWLLPSLGVFLAGHTAFEVGFVVGGGGGGHNNPAHHHQQQQQQQQHEDVSSPSCFAATLVVAHQVRFAMTLVPHGIIIALNTLFSKEFGARRFSAAQTVMLSSLYCLAAVTVTEGGLLLYFQDSIPGFFHTSDACVKRQFSRLVGSMVFALVCEYLVWYCVTLLRCMGHRSRALSTTFVAWWAVTLPSICFFAWAQHRGAASVFDGAVVGQGFVAPVAMLFCYSAWGHELRHDEKLRHQQQRTFQKSSRNISSSSSSGVISAAHSQLNHQQQQEQKRRPHVVEASELLRNESDEDDERNYEYVPS